MVYMEPHVLGWEPLILSWLNELPETLTVDHKALIKGLFERYMECLLNFIRKGGAKVRYNMKSISLCDHEMK